MSAPMVVAAARALCSQYASTCNVDEDDAWKVYGDSFLQYAGAALQAMGATELLSALQLVRMSAGWQVLSAESRQVIDAALAKAEGRS